MEFNEFKEKEIKKIRNDIEYHVEKIRELEMRLKIYEVE